MKLLLYILFAIAAFAVGDRLGEKAVRDLKSSRNTK